jgi:isocitrate/isopropylmalate dehydrogenase
MSFDDNFNTKVVMAEAPHGTAPSLFGKNVANPMAMILAGASLLTYFNDAKATAASRAIYESVIETVREGIRTADLGGSSTTTEFTNEVIRKVQTKLEVWTTLQGF